MQSGNFVIESLLPVGKENRISTKQLVNLIGCSSSRELQQLIAEERKNGAVILSATSGGYYKPANRAEMAEFCKSLENRAKNTFVAIRSTKKALSKLEGQQEITEGGVSCGT